MSNYCLLTTPPGYGGISVVELLGSNACSIIGKVFKPRQKSFFNRIIPHRLYLGEIYQDIPLNSSGRTERKLIDEVIINFIPARESFSGLDTIQINSHGGPVVTQTIINLLKEYKVKPITIDQLKILAQKHHRIDLVQAEAWEFLQRAQTILVSKVLLDQYNGALSRRIKLLIKRLRKFQQRCQGNTYSFQEKNKKRIQSTISHLLNTARFGIPLVEPKHLVIAGPTNSGKSTLFNALLGHNRVIVHHQAGTSRDIIEDSFAIEGIPFRLSDTAGLRPLNKRFLTSEDEIEKEGIRRAQKLIKKADLIIFLLDGSRPLNHQIFKTLHELKSQKILLVVNKNDLPQKLNPEELKQPYLSISALHQRGLDKLKAGILAHFDLQPHFYYPNRPIIFTTRQYQLLHSCIKNLSNLQKAIDKLTRILFDLPSKKVML